MSQINQSELSDFWWLPKIRAKENWLVCVGHHHPLTDDDNPCSIKWFQSVGVGRELSYELKKYRLDFLAKWRALCNNTNVYRSLELFPSETGQSEVLGPFLVDIDNSSLQDGYKENLHDSLLVTRGVVGFLRNHWKLRSFDIRIFFSGRKGFNIEICPEALGINGSIADQIGLSANKLEEIIKQFGTGSNEVSEEGTNIDRIYGSCRSGYKLKHPYIRLHGSWNEWALNNNMRKARRKIELAFNELDTLTVGEICARAERTG
jgi:hypothetical protein